MAARALSAVFSAPDPSAAGGNGRSRGVRALRARARSADRRASTRRLSAAPDRRRPSGSRRSSRWHAAPAACRWSRWRSRSLRRGAPSISGSSTCSIGSPPVQHDEGRRAAVSPPGVAAGPGERIGVANLPPPSPSVPTKSVSQNLQVAVCAVLPRGRSTDCSRQSGRTRQAAPLARLRPAACRRSP